MSSILPMVLREMVRPMRMMEHQMRLMQEELLHPHYFPSVFRTIPYNHKPWTAIEYTEDKDTNVLADKDKFQVKMDVKHFQPNEITVKMGDCNSVVVEAKHEEKTDEKGFISREIIRRFLIPDGHDLKQIASSLSSDGILTITAPKNPEAAERVIPITQTGPEREEDKKEEVKN